MEMNYICVHHFGAPVSNPLFKSSVLTEFEINEQHRMQWPDMPSELSYSFIGYNFIIWPNGDLKQYRLIGEETVAQKGHNFDAVSVCLAGNFTKQAELPTVAQKMRLKSLIRDLVDGNILNLNLRVKHGTTLKIAPNNIYPHRVLQPNHTACYGNALDDSWARNLLSENSMPSPIFTPEPKREVLVAMIESLKKLVGLYQVLIAKKKLGGFSSQCFFDVRG